MLCFPGFRPLPLAGLTVPSPVHPQKTFASNPDAPPKYLLPAHAPESSAIGLAEHSPPGSSKSNPPPSLHFRFLKASPSPAPRKNPPLLCRPATNKTPAAPHPAATSVVPRPPARPAACSAPALPATPDYATTANPHSPPSANRRAPPKTRTILLCQWARRRSKWIASILGVPALRSSPAPARTAVSASSERENIPRR